MDPRQENSSNLFEPALQLYASGQNMRGKKPGRVTYATVS